MAVIGYVLKLHNSLLGINMIYHHISCGKRKYIPQKINVYFWDIVVDWYSGTGCWWRRKESGFI